jgi:hypothetical protein
MSTEIAGLVCRLRPMGQNLTGAATVSNLVMGQVIESQAHQSSADKLYAPNNGSQCRG